MTSEAKLFRISKQVSRGEKNLKVSASINHKEVKSNFNCSIFAKNHPSVESFLHGIDVEKQKMFEANQQPHYEAKTPMSESVPGISRCRSEQINQLFNQLPASPVRQQLQQAKRLLQSQSQSQYETPTKYRNREESQVENNQLTPIVDLFANIVSQEDALYEELGDNICQHEQVASSFVAEGAKSMGRFVANASYNRVAITVQLLSSIKTCGMESHHNISQVFQHVLNVAYTDLRKTLKQSAVLVEEDGSTVNAKTYMKNLNKIESEKVDIEIKRHIIKSFKTFNHEQDNSSLEIIKDLRKVFYGAISNMHNNFQANEGQKYFVGYENFTVYTMFTERFKNICFNNLSLILELLHATEPTRKLYVVSHKYKIAELPSRLTVSLCFKQAYIIHLLTINTVYRMLCQQL